jgi:hypothetical protein
MQRVAAEIADKQRRGLPLNPELKLMEPDTRLETNPHENAH